jgi:hypothetical protein
MRRSLIIHRDAIPFLWRCPFVSAKFLLAEPNGEWVLHRIVHLLATQNAQATGATEMTVRVLPGGPPPKSLGGNGAAR